MKTETNTTTIHWFRRILGDLYVEVTHEGMRGLLILAGGSQGWEVEEMKPRQFSVAHNNEDDIAEILGALDDVIRAIYQRTGDTMPFEWSEKKD